MNAFDLSQSRLYVSLLGMKKTDARHFVTMAATLQALHENNRRSLEAYAYAR